VDATVTLSNRACLSSAWISRVLRKAMRQGREVVIDQWWRGNGDEDVALVACWKDAGRSREAMWCPCGGVLNGLFHRRDLGAE
jgi:hypothetical protein